MAEPDNDLGMANPVDGQPHYLRHSHWSDFPNPLYNASKIKIENNELQIEGNFNFELSPTIITKDFIPTIITYNIFIKIFRMLFYYFFNFR